MALNAVGNLNFIGALALHQNRRDMALGLNHVTTKTRGLLWYYNIKQQEIATKSFYYGVIIGCRKRLKQIKKQVKIDTPIEQAQMLYREALVLQEQIVKAEKVIDG